MDIVRGLCVKGLQLVYVCYKCKGVWCFKQDLTIPNIVIGVVSKKTSSKEPRFRKDSS